MEDNETNIKPVDVPPVNAGLRLANLIIDSVIRFLIISVIIKLMPVMGYARIITWLQTGSTMERLQKEAPIDLCIGFLYYFLFELFWQRTPAKFITKTYVVNVAGNAPVVTEVLLRTIVRFVPFEAFSFLAGPDMGWHDRWSKTRVVGYL